MDTHAVLMGAGGGAVSLSVEMRERGETTVKIPALAPYEIITVFSD